MKKKLAKVEEINVLDENISEQDKEEEIKEIKFTVKPSVKNLPSPKATNITDREIIEKEELTNTIEALDEIMPTETASAKSTEGIEIETPDLQDLVPQKILNYHENFSLINGGFSQYEKIKQYIGQELENVPEDLLKKILEQLKELQLIHDSIKIGGFECYLFNDISLNDDEKKFIEFSINKKPMIKEQFIQDLNWEEEKILLTMKRLQEKGILRIDKNFIIIPGIVQL